MFAAGSKEDGSDKDTIQNIKDNGEFVVNIVTFELKDQMNLTSTPLPYGKSEVNYADIKTIASNLIRPPRIVYSPINMECKCIKIVKIPELGKETTQVVFGEVLGIHIDDAIIKNGIIDFEKLQPLCRLGYDRYAVIQESFKMSKMF